MVDNVMVYPRYKPMRDKEISECEITLASLVIHSPKYLTPGADTLRRMAVMQGVS